MVRTVVLGTEKLDAKAADLRREAARFQRRVSAAVGRETRRVYFPTLIGMLPRFMPSGYGPTLAKDLEVGVMTRFAGTSPGVSVRVSAPTGGPQGRAVRALERGELRHPVFARGRRDEWRWAKRTQRIPRGFASTPLDAVKPLIVREIDKELGAIKRDVES